MAMSGLRMKNLSSPIIVPDWTGKEARPFWVLSDTLIGMLTTDRRLVLVWCTCCWDPRRDEWLNNLHEGRYRFGCTVSISRRKNE